MQRRILTLILLLASCTCAGAQQLPDKSDFHLFLLIGQSNMAGRGNMTETDKQPTAGVLMLDQQDRWVPAVDPLHFDKPRVVGVGLGRSFAEAVRAANPQVTIGLVPCAAGGSPISSWQPGGYHGQTKSHPYDDMLVRIRIALKSGTLQAILWHQGESDSKAQLAPHYEEKLIQLVDRLRAELNHPTVPFIVGQMGMFAERPWDEHRQTVDAAHQALPSKRARTAFVSSAGLTHKGDKVHFDSASYRELGRRYAKAYLKLSSEKTK